MNTPGKVTDNERQLVKEFLVIPVMLEYVEGDISMIRQSGLRTDLILIGSLKKVHDAILFEHFGVKLRLKKSGLKVYEINRSASGIEASFLCRGYHHKMTLLWSVVRTEVLNKASQYTGVQISGV